MNIRRESSKNSFSLNTAVGTTQEIPYLYYAGGMIFVPTGSSITSLTWHVAPEAGGTYLPAQDSDGAAVTQTVAAAKAYPIPEALFGAPYIKAVVDAAGSVTISFKG